MEDPEKMFNDFVKGKYKIADGLSTAKFWSRVRGPDDKDGPNVPRPDINIGWLTVAAFFSLDHLYLRSPVSGFLKVITFGGLGLWWLWDLVQLFGERDRVLKYGMSAPFDFWTGIGQGMIYESPKGDDEGKKWQYEPTSSMGTWMMLLLIGFTGADWIYLGKTWQGLRRLFYFAMVLAFMSGFIVSVNNAINGEGFVWAIFSGLPFLILLIPVLSIWISNMNDFLKEPTKVFDEGLKNPSVAVSFLGWPQKLFMESGQIIGSDEWKDRWANEAEKLDKGAITFSRWRHVREYFMIDSKGITEEVFKSIFAIKNTLPVKSPSPPSPPSPPQSGGASTEQATSSTEGGDDVAGIPPIDLAWQAGEIVYDQVSSVAYGILDAVAMATPWGAAAKTAQLALKAAAKQGGIQLPTALTKGNPMAALRGLASEVGSKGFSKAVGNVAKQVGSEALSTATKGMSQAVGNAVSAKVADVAGVATKVADVAGVAARVAMDPKGLAGVASRVAMDPKGLAGVASKVADVAGGPTGSKGMSQAVGNAKPLPSATKQEGGGSTDSLSLEAHILGASVIAIISGGTLKSLIDYLVSE